MVSEIALEIFSSLKRLGWSWMSTDSETKRMIEEALTSFFLETDEQEAIEQDVQWLIENTPY